MSSDILLVYYTNINYSDMGYFRWNSSKSGFKNKIAPPPRKDFALFLKVQIIGSSEGINGYGKMIDTCA